MTVHGTTLKTARERFVEDYTLALIVLVAATAFVFVTPFAVFRWIEGSYVVAILDALIVAIPVASAIWAWRTGNTGIPGLIIALVLCAGAVAVASQTHLSGAFWLFPAIMFIFYLTRPVVALLMAVASLASIIAMESGAPGSFFTAPVEMVSFLASSTTAAIFSFVFALRTNRQREMLTNWAIRDPLTGLYNRRNLDEELRIAIASRDRHGADYGLVILDLDNFKTINDVAGHAVGDQILRDLAELIRTHTRVGDRAFRYGGDEFVILLPATSAEGLRKIAENLVASIADSLQHPEQSATASVGAALLLPDDDVESWNRRADRCLYEAKELGRNRAVVDTGRA